MKKFIFLLTILFLLILLIGFVSAVPANPAPFTLEQQDGTKFQARQVGDERNAWIETSDGYTIIQNSMEQWTYAEKSSSGSLKSTDKIVGKDSPQGIKKHIMASIDSSPKTVSKSKRKNIEILFEKSSPANLVEGVLGAPDYSPGTIGTEYIVVIPINFTNKNFATDKNQDYYWDLLFNESNPGSLNSYYKEVSYGKLNLVGIITPIVNSSKTMEWYGRDGPPNTCGKIDGKNGCIYELAREAVYSADPYINYSQYDKDGNGWVDHIMVIHAGYDQAGTHIADDIWSHSWGISGVTQLDGVFIGSYIMLAETDPIGIYAHEFGHDLGLPDLYNTQTGEYVVAYWDLMDGGSWGGSPQGTKPVHISSWGKAQLNWLSPKILNGSILTTNVNQLAFNNDSYRLEDIFLNKENEYFLVENRQKTGFDAGLPSSYNTGLVIWHIDNKQGNNNGATKMVYPELAGGSLASAPFFSPSYTFFNSTSSPNTNTNSGNKTGVYAINIGSSSSSMPVTLFGGFARLEPYLITTSKDVTKNQFFDFKVGVRCAGGDCGDISALLDPVAITCNNSPCVATSDMIKSKDSIDVSEPNQPNTIGGCADGNQGNYTLDETVESITLKDLDGIKFIGGDTIEVNATIFCTDYSGPPDNDPSPYYLDDQINFVYTNNSASPQWRVLKNIVHCPGPGFQTVTHQFKLDNVNGTHTVRVLVVYSPGTTEYSTICGNNANGYPQFSDTDDVSIIVNPGKGIISTTLGATPFYTTSPQPQTCLNMGQGDTCNLTWQVNATGALGLYKFFAIFNSNLPIPQVESSKVDITIAEPSAISITFYGGDLSFGTISPGVETEAPENYSLIVESSVGNVDVYQKGTNFSTASNSFSVTNMEWAETSGGTKIPLSNNYAKILDSKSSGTYNMYYWLTVPYSVVPDANYLSDITITAVLEDSGTPLGSSPIKSTPTKSTIIKPQETPKGGASVNVIKLN